MQFSMCVFGKLGEEIATLVQSVMLPEVPSRFSLSLVLILTITMLVRCVIVYEGLSHTVSDLFLPTTLRYKYYCYYFTKM